MLNVFAKRLKMLRLSRRLTMKQAGDAIGSSPQTISNLENIQKSPSLNMVLALADFFDVSVDYLVGRTNDPARPRCNKTAEASASALSEQENFFDAFIGLRKENIDKAMSYVAFLRETQRREDEKNVGRCGE